MDWTPITSGHRCVLSMEQNSKLVNHVPKVPRIAHSLCQLSVGVRRLFNFFLKIIESPLVYETIDEVGEWKTCYNRIVLKKY